jgi:hypothetical protein
MLISGPGRPASEPAALINGGRCFRARDAEAVGLTLRAKRALLADGRLQQILRGVLVDVRHAHDLATRVPALDLVRPADAVVVRATAAWLRGVDVRGPGAKAPVVVECIVPVGRTPVRRPGVRCYEAPLAGDVEEVGGIPCTIPVRTAIDLLRYQPPHVGLAGADAMAHAGMFRVEALREGVERWKGGRTIERARRLASHCEPLTESFGETWTRLRILDAGFPPPKVQVPLGSEGRVEFRLDLGYPERRVSIEYDGLEFHSSRADRRHDEARRARIRDVYGWTVVGVGRGEILGSSLAFEQGVGELLGLEPQIRRRTW